MDDCSRIQIAVRTFPGVMAAVQGVLDRVLPATPPRRFVKGEGQSDPSGSGSCGPGAMVLTGVCAVGGILLTMQTVSHINTLPDLEKIALSALASVFFVVLSNALLTFGPTRNHGEREREFALFEADKTRSAAFKRGAPQGALELGFTLALLLMAAAKRSHPSHTLSALLFALFP